MYIRMYLLLFMYLQLFNITKTGVYLVIIYVSTTSKDFSLNCEYFAVFSHIFQCVCTYMCISLYLAIYFSVYVYFSVCILATYLFEYVCVCVYTWVFLPVRWMRIDTLEMKNWFGYLNLIDYPGLVVSTIASVSVMYLYSVFMTLWNHQMRLLKMCTSYYTV